MSTYFTLSDAAQAIGITVQALRKRADIQAMKDAPFVALKRRGGGKSYELSNYPVDIQAALLRWHSERELQPVVVDGGQGADCKSADPMLEPMGQGAEVVEADPIGYTVTNGDGTRREREIDAWLEIFRLQRGFCAAAGIGRVVDCDASFAQAWNSGGVECAEWVREAIKSLSRATLARWRSRFKRDGLDGLSKRYGHRKGCTKIASNPELHQFAVAMLVQHPHCGAMQIEQAMAARFAGVALPSRSAIGRWIENWKAENRELFTAVTNPDAWKNKYMVAFGSYSEGIERPNQLWELDSTPADLLLTDGRYNLVGLIDVATRRPRLLVTKTSKATAIIGLFRWGLLNWGVPEAIKTDNGRDYTANHVQRVVATLGIEHLTCQPFQPWQKPHIERFFNTFSHGLVELLPGYAGHDVAERQAIRARQSFADRLFAKDQAVEIRMGAAELQGMCDRWCEAFVHRAHDGLGGKSPHEILMGYRGPIRKIGDPRALDILLAEAPTNNGYRIVQKRGIKVEDAWFVAADLEAFVGEQVQVRFDPFDVGRVYVFGDDGFICMAECPERTGVSRAEVAAVAKQMQKERVQKERRLLKETAKAVKLDDIVNEILASQEQATAKVTPLFAPVEETQSLPEFEAAATEGAKPKARPELKISELAIKEAERAREELRQQREAAELAEQTRLITTEEWLDLSSRRVERLSERELERMWLYVEHCERVGMSNPCEGIPNLRLVDYPARYRAGLSYDRWTDLLDWVEERRPERYAALRLESGRPARQVF